MSTALAPRYSHRRRILTSGDTLSVVRAAGRAELPVIGPVTISALPQVANLLIYQGDTFFLFADVFDPDGQPVDMTEMTVKSQVRAGPADEDPVVLAELDSSVLDNQITLFLPHATTTTLHGALVWDMQITDLAGWVTTLAAGTVTVTPEVTR